VGEESLRGKSTLNVNAVPTAEETPLAHTVTGKIDLG
jgi:hypothetical protein